MIVKLVWQVSLQQVACEEVNADAAALSLEVIVKLVWQVSSQQVACGMINA